jgi:FeS assembly SUF system protein
MSTEEKPATPPAPPVAAGAAEIDAKVEEASRIQDLQDRIVAVLQTCFDPEIPVNIHELGLIYGVDVTPEGAVTVRMTLTSPACPAAGSLPPEVESKVRGVAGVTSAKVDVVWDPIWTPERMSEAARLQLGMF